MMKILHSFNLSFFIWWRKSYMGLMTQGLIPGGAFSLAKSYDWEQLTKPFLDLLRLLEKFSKSHQMTAWGSGCLPPDPCTLKHSGRPARYFRLHKAQGGELRSLPAKHSAQLPLQHNRGMGKGGHGLHLTTFSWQSSWIRAIVSEITEQPVYMHIFNLTEVI